jgi:hypothetical protein
VSGFTGATRRKLLSPDTCHPSPETERSAVTLEILEPDTPAAEVIEVGGKLEIIEVAQQGTPGAPGASMDNFDVDLVLIFETAQL